MNFCFIVTVPPHSSQYSADLSGFAFHRVHGTYRLPNPANVFGVFFTIIRKIESNTATHGRCCSQDYEQKCWLGKSKRKSHGRGGGKGRVLCPRTQLCRCKWTVTEAFRRNTQKGAVPRTKRYNDEEKDDRKSVGKPATQCSRAVTAIAASGKKHGTPLPPQLALQRL